MILPAASGLDAEADPHRLGCLDDLAFGRNILDLANRLFDPNISRLVVEIADHVAKFLLLDQLHRSHTKTNAKNAIIGTRGPAPLQMAQNHRTRLPPGTIHDFPGDPRANPGRTNLALGCAVDDQFLVTLWCRAFGHHDQGRGLPTRHPPFNVGTETFVRKGNFRNQDDVSSSGKTSVEGDPAGRSPHDLKHHHSLVARRGRSEAVERINHAMDGGIESERPGGRGKIVIDGLGDSDNRHAVLKKLFGGRQGIISTDADQGLQAQVKNRPFRFVDDPLRNPGAFARKRLGHEMALAGRADHGASLGGDSLGIFQSERLVVPGKKQPLVAADETDNLPAEGMGRHHRRANNRVRPGAIGATG